MDDLQPLFRRLSPDEEVDFRAWARENHRPGDPVEPMWHPVVRDECAKIDAEAARQEADTSTA